ncbi:MAG: PDDEXK nuclease domain-containing protein [Bacilli bacterium]|nr:PDDEXK nuclease domain-containing protein [Bacilli bacterium]
MEKFDQKVLSILDDDYQNWITDLKKRYRQSQIKASIHVNSELIRFYWSLGRDIVKMKAVSRWGSGFYNTLSKDLKEQFKDSKGFSPTNLKYMRQFYELFPENENRQQLVDQIYAMPWGHLVMITISSQGNQNKALFYISKTIENGWSRSMLEIHLDTNLYERQGKAINNFETTMPKEKSDLAVGITKDPYSFNFLSLDEDYSEKELKDGLIDNIQRFLLELGTGFAYMGREYRLVVGSTEQFIDMLFYNTKVHAYVVIEVKTTPFKPEYTGQLGTYVVAVDHLLKSETDAKTIGILVCREKDELLTRYAIESSSQPIGISSFELSKMIPDDFKGTLPSIEELENELSLKTKNNKKPKRKS